MRWPAFAPGTQSAGAAARAAVFTPAPLESADTPAVDTVVPSPSLPEGYTTPVSEWAAEMLVSSRVAPEQLYAGAGGSPEPTGFIGGALKKTKDSLVKTGAVTSASLGTAVRGVVGAFKKVSPF